MVQSMHSAKWLLIANTISLCVGIVMLEGNMMIFLLVQKRSFNTSTAISWKFVVVALHGGNFLYVSEEEEEDKAHRLMVNVPK